MRLWYGKTCRPVTSHKIRTNWALHTKPAIWYISDSVDDDICMLYVTNKGIGSGPAGPILVGPLFIKVKTKFHFAKSKY